MNAVVRILKNWTLPVAITAGALAYFAYSNCPYLLQIRSEQKNGKQFHYSSDTLTTQAYSSLVFLAASN